MLERPPPMPERQMLERPPPMPERQTLERPPPMPAHPRPSQRRRRHRS